MTSWYDIKYAIQICQKQDYDIKLIDDFYDLHQMDVSI